MTIVHQGDPARDLLSTQLRSAVRDSVAWMRRVMFPVPDGSGGIWERVLVDREVIQYWVRCDCSAESARALLYLSQEDDDPALRAAAGKLLGYVLSRQYPSGAFPFFDVVVPPDKDIAYPEPGEGIWPNDNGKILGVLVELGDEFPELDLWGAARKLADYFVASQNEAGWWRLNDIDYPGTCFVTWPLIGLSRLWQRTGVESYRSAALRALAYLKSLQLPNGRVRTSYEISRIENWRPVSSENAMALLAFSVAQQSLAEDLTQEIEACGRFVLSLAADTGAIRNCDAASADASEQNDPDLTDLVYTNGYGLFAFTEAYRATGQTAYRDAAIALARFLASIQCRDESPLWDGAWRGSYDVVRKEWRGRANHQNPLDEGGMYSVYTGWCAAPITAGLLLALNLK